MHMRLKGIHSAVMRLADGTTRTYHYAWRGGPRLTGEPGSPEFVASYNKAIARKAALPVGVLLAILTKYQNSDAFRQLTERTRKDYAIQIKIIERAFGDLPVAALPDRRTCGIFMEWRDKLAEKSRRQADYAWAVLALILSWAFDRGLVTHNPCERGGLLYRASRVDKIWSDADEAAFLAKAPNQLRLPLMLALWTGQRQGDLLRLPWSGYDGEFIRLRQVGSPLKLALNEAAQARRSPVILLNSRGMPWTSDGFRTSWGKACAAAGIVGLTFHDLRGTAVTRLAVAGCTEPEIVTITGHTLKDVRSILDANYLHRDPALAERAIRKLETRAKREPI